MLIPHLNGRLIAETIKAKMNANWISPELSERSNMEKNIHKKYSAEIVINKAIIKSKKRLTVNTFLEEFSLLVER